MIDRLVGQAGGEIQGDGHQRRMPALPLETSDMLNRGFVSLTCKLAQACLVDQMSAAGIDAYRANMFQAFNHTEHGDWCGGLWHLPQPGQPDLAGFVPAFGQSIKSFSLISGQPVGQPAIHLPAALMTELSTKPFERERRRTDYSTLPARFQGQCRQMSQPVVLHRVRQERLCQFRCRVLAEVTKSSLPLALDGLTLPIPFICKILINRRGEHADLFCNKFEHGHRRPFADLQSPAGIAQIAAHEGEAQAVVVAATARDGCQVGLRQRVIPDQLTLLGRRIKQLRNLDFAQSLPSCHSCLLAFGPSRPSDPGQRVD